MQEYNQNELVGIRKPCWGSFLQDIISYVPKRDDARAALNFHLTKREKQNISQPLDNDIVAGFEQLCQLIRLSSDAPTKKAAIAGKP